MSYNLILSNLSILKWNIIKFAKYILISRADYSAPLKVELLYTMGSPSNNASHSKYRSIYFLWQTNHLIYETTIKV